LGGGGGVLCRVRVISRNNLKMLYSGSGNLSKPAKVRKDQ
jgi:hypothetical protein